MRNVEPLPTPAAMNSAMNASTKPSRLPPLPAVGRKNTATSGATAMTTKIQNVMIAPPTRSASQPPSGTHQRRQHRPDERELERVRRRELGVDQHREARREPDERAEGAGVEPAHPPLLLVPDDRHLLGEARAHRGDVVHAEPGGDHGQRRSAAPR